MVLHDRTGPVLLPGERPVSRVVPSAERRQHAAPVRCRRGGRRLGAFVTRSATALRENGDLPRVRVLRPGGREGLHRGARRGPLAVLAAEAREDIGEAPLPSTLDEHAEGRGDSPAALASDGEPEAHEVDEAAVEELLARALLRHGSGHPLRLARRCGRAPLQDRTRVRARSPDELLPSQRHTHSVCRLAPIA